MTRTAKKAVEILFKEGDTVNAELISVGTEILLGQIINTNAAWLAEKLAEYGINVFRQITIGDNLSRLTDGVRESLQRAEVVILTGGLGPTDDDLTREGVAAALGLDLVEDIEQRKWLETRFSGGARSMPVNNLKQALKPLGAELLPNPNGTACGYAIHHDGRWVFMLPGPPWEMEAMFNSSVVPILKDHFSLDTKLFHRTLRFIGIGESALEMELLDMMRSQSDPSMALYAKMGEIELRLTTRASDQEEADKRLDPQEQLIRERVGRFIYGYNQDTLFSVLARELVERGLTLSVAESCTSGLLGSSFTDIPGSSSFFQGGFLTYSNEMKQQMVDVPEELLIKYGAVSARVAVAMAEGARKKTGTDLALSVTGIAGPGGATETKPVGLTYIALATSESTYILRSTYSSDRVRNKSRAAKQAAYLLWLTLMGYDIPEVSRASLEP